MTSGKRPKSNIHSRGSAIQIALRRFAREEDGNLIIFGVYAFVLMLMMTGIGIDLMRFERDRSVLQYTLDRAVLAAADLDQPLEPEAVVADYLNKAGLGDKLQSVSVREGLGFRTVTAEAKSQVHTQFMHMTGIDTLLAPASSTAEESIGGVEISLVLDVSGSMNRNSRLPNLKVAAKDFIDTMVDNTEDGKLSISIVPYATQVSAPDNFFAEFKTTDEHSYSNCINFQAEHFNTTAIDTKVELQRTMHFDPWEDFDGRDNDPMQLVRSPVCEADDAREMVILQKSRSTLKTFIDNLSAAGNTSIDVGMKWGTALLDPSLQTVVDALIEDGTVAADFDARPHLYTDRESLKVIVLMTDGQNTSQYFIEDGYREGNSNIWWNDEQEIYSVYVGLDDDDEDRDGITNEPLFYWPHTNEWQDHAYGEGVYEETSYEWECRSYRRNGSCRRYRQVATTVTVDEPGSAEIVSYADLWAWTSMEWIVEDLYEPWMDDNQAWNDWYYSVRDYVNSTVKDARTKAICDAAKDKNIIVFTIGFEAPYSGQTVLKDCASSDSHYFDVEGLEISDAFSAIASSIRQLRLTQ